MIGYYVNMRPKTCSIFLMAIIDSSQVNYRGSYHAAIAVWGCLAVFTEASVVFLLSHFEQPLLTSL